MQLGWIGALLQYRMKIILFIMIFFILGGLLIISNNNLALIYPENFDTFSGLYSEWLNNVYSNSYSITGKIIQLDWLPKE